MAKALQRRRGTHEEHKSFTGLEGEFTYDTTEKRIVAHDGVTKGGIPMAKKAELDSTKTELEGKIEQVSSSLDPRILDAASQSDILEAVSQATVGNVDAPTLEGLQAQIAANASNINTKLDESDKAEIVGWGMPDYSAMVSVASFPYTVPMDGYVKVVVYGGNYGGISINVNSENVTDNYYQQDAATFSSVDLIPVAKGDVIYTQRNSGGRFFIPCKGAN